MLATLRIKNLALVADLTVDFEAGYNVITGETGAGKSILIGALNLVLGERADRTLIRSGCESCSVEAVFDVAQLRSPLPRFLEENGLEPCEENQLVLKRAFTSAGTNRQFVNGSPTTLQILATVGEWLVDIHGPHEHQSLIHPAIQLAILDAFGDLSPLRQNFQEFVRSREALLAEKSALIVDERTYAQQLDLLRHQAAEIEAAKLNPEEELTLEQEHQRASHAARLLELARTATSLINEDEGSLVSAAGALGRILHEVHGIDAAATSLVTLHGQMITALRELQQELSMYADRIDLDSDRLHQLEERLNLIHSLKRKYGGSLVEVVAFGAEARRKLESLEKRDTELNRINQELASLERDLIGAGNKLSAARQKVIPKLCRSATSQLADLGFKRCHFEIAITSADRLAGFASQIPLSGFDSVEFQFAPNIGEPPRPLRAIASSGEMARVMLALKTVLASQDEIPVLIFDEVDANVGGETAQAVGAKMRQIAQKHQVLCITHLAQVAAAADVHYVITKQVNAGRTISAITLLENETRIDELARMLGDKSSAARELAAALLSRDKTGSKPSSSP